MKKYVINLGLNDKDLHYQVVNDYEVEKMLVYCTKEVKIVGATIKTGLVGIYKGEKEKTVEITIVDVEENKVMLLCELLKKAFNQECVMLEIFENAEIKFA
jgi:PII-like signaling protein